MWSSHRFERLIGILIFAFTRLLPALGTLLFLLVSARYLGTETGGEVAAWLIAITFMAILGRFGGDRMVQRLHAKKEGIPAAYLLFICGFTVFTSMTYAIYLHFSGGEKVLLTFSVIVLCSILYVAQAIIRSLGHKYFSAIFDPGVSFLISAIIIFVWAELTGWFLDPYFLALCMLISVTTVFFGMFPAWKRKLLYAGWPDGAVSVFISTLSGQGAKNFFWFTVSFFAGGVLLYNMNVAYKYAQLGNFLLSIANQRWYTRYTKDPQGLKFATSMGLYLGVISFFGYLILFFIISLFDFGINDISFLAIFSASVLINNLFGPMGFYLSMIGRERVNIIANIISIFLAIFCFFVVGVLPENIPFVYMAMIVVSNTLQAVMARKYVNQN